MASLVLVQLVLVGSQKCSILDSRGVGIEMSSMLEIKPEQGFSSLALSFERGPNA